MNMLSGEEGHLTIIEAAVDLPYWLSDLRTCVLLKLVVEMLQF